MDQPYGFPTVTNVTSSDRTRMLPRELSTSGTIPGNTDMNLNGTNVVISGRNSDITVSDTANVRVLFGLRSSTGKYGFYVSKPGFDVTMTADSNLVSNSDQDSFKIADQTIARLGDTLTPFPSPIASGASGTFLMSSVPYTHNLNYTPATILQRYGQSVGQFSQASPGMQDITMTGAGTGASGLVIGYTYLFVTVTSATINFSLYGTYSNSSNANATLGPFLNGTTYKAFLLQETAN